MVQCQNIKHKTNKKKKEQQMSTHTNIRRGRKWIVSVRVEFVTKCKWPRIGNKSKGNHNHGHQICGEKTVLKENSEDLRENRRWDGKRCPRSDDRWIKLIPGNQISEARIHWSNENSTERRAFTRPCCRSSRPEWTLRLLAGNVCLSRWFAPVIELVCL